MPHLKDYNLKAQILKDSIRGILSNFLLLVVLISILLDVNVA